MTVGHPEAHIVGRAADGSEERHPMHVRKADSMQQILVIDDDPFDQALIRSAFQRVGSNAHVTTMPDVSVAIGLLESGTTPALLIVDLKLGYETGLELIGWVRRHDTLGATPMVVMSGSDDPVDVRSAYEAGANAYVVKPGDLEGLEQLVRALDLFWFGACALPGAPVLDRSSPLS